MAATIQYRKTTADLGGAATSTQLSATAMNNLWDNVTAAQASAGGNEYRAVDLYNAGDAVATLVAFFSTATTSTGTEIEAGIEASPIGSTTSVADEATAPSGVAFAVRSAAAKLTLPNVAVGAYCRVWLKRAVTAGTGNLANDSTTMTVEYA